MSGRLQPAGKLEPPEMLDTPLLAGSISAFPVPPKDQLITITFGQLQFIISAAVAEATKPLLERLSTIESNQTTLQREILDLRASSEAEITRVCEDIAFDRRRLCQLEQQSRIPPTTPGEKTAARITHIKTILKDRGATTFKELCRILDISAREMSRITKRLDMRFYEITRRPGDARQKVLRLRSQIG